MVSIRKLGAIAGGAIAVVTGLVIWFGPWYGSGGPRLATESAVRAREGKNSLPILVLLDPGTIVESAIPEGWSHSVIKSVTYLASGDTNTLPSFAKDSATKFRTVILADVRRDSPEDRYHLVRIGAGLGTLHDGKDTIIDSDTLQTQGIELSTLDRMVLGRAERALGRSRITARTSTFVLYDTFVELADAQGKHRSILLRYAMLVDPATGGLRTVYWPVAEHAADRTVPETMSLLPSNCIFRCGVHVAAKRVIGNLASSWGFAMTDVPKGASLPMPETMRRAAIQDPGQIDASAMEIELRAVLGDRQPPKPEDLP